MGFHHMMQRTRAPALDDLKDPFSMQKVNLWFPGGGSRSKLPVFRPTQPSPAVAFRQKAT